MGYVGTTQNGFAAADRRSVTARYRISGARDPFSDGQRMPAMSTRLEAGDKTRRNPRITPEAAMSIRINQVLRPAPRLLGAALAACVLVTGGILTKRALASDHQDSPEVELNPAMDMIDFYAFPGATSGNIVLAMDSWAFLTPAETPMVSFDPNQLYQFKIDNTGDAKEDLVIQVTFQGTGANQTVQVRGPLAPPVVGAMQNTVANVTPVITGKVNTVLTAKGMKFFAGPRSDPFFIDLEQFFRILPDRKPVTGPLSMLPSTPSASGFRNPGIDYVLGHNVLSIVLELPSSMLTTGGNSKIGLWGTISR
jgi:hypothetical protein